MSRTASRAIAAIAALVLAAATVSPALIVGSCVGKAASCAWPSFADRIFSSGVAGPAAPVPNKPHRANFPFGWRALLVVWRTLFFTPGPIKVEPAKGDEWNRGNYLVHAVEVAAERLVADGEARGLGRDGQLGAVLR